MTTEPLTAAPAGVDEDAWTAACAAVRAYCGWHVAPSVTESVTVDGSGGDVQFLPTLHLTELHSILNDGSAVVAPEWSEAGMVRAHGWSSKFRSVVANITHGYGECPAEIVGVLRDLAAGADRGGVAQVTAGSHSVRFEPTLGASHRAVLDRYRIGLRP